MITFIIRAEKTCTGTRSGVVQGGDFRGGRKLSPKSSAFASIYDEKICNKLNCFVADFFFHCDILQ